MFNINIITRHLLKIIGYLPHIGLISAIAIVLFLSFTGNMIILVYGLCVLIPVILTLLLLLSQKSKMSFILSSFEDIPKLNINHRLLCKVYYIVLFILVCWILMSAERDLIFTILITLLYSITSVSIFTKNIEHWHIIIQLILTTTILLLTKGLLYYMPIALNDLFCHAEIVNSIVHYACTDFISYYDTGISHLAAAPYDSVYFYHLSGALLSLLSNLSANYSLIIISGVEICVASIFIYYITHYLTKSQITSIFSVVGYFSITYIQKFGWEASSKTIATVMFIILVYLFLSRSKNNLCFYIVLGIIISINISFSHHANTLLYIAIFNFFVLMYAVYFKHVSKEKIILIIIINLTILSIATYMYLTGILQYFDLLLTILSPSYSSPVAAVMGKSFSSGISIYLLSYSAYAVFFVVPAILGLFSLVYQNMGEVYKTIILIPVAFLFPFFIEGVYYVLNLSDNEIISRIISILSPFMAIVIGVGIVTLVALLSKISHYKKLLVFISCSFLILLLLSSGFFYSSRDMMVFEGTDIYDNCYHFDKSDIYVGKFIQSTIVSNIYIDYGYFREARWTGVSFNLISVNDLINLGHNLNDYDFFLFRYGWYLNEQLIIGETKLQTNEFIKNGRLINSKEMNSHVEHLNYNLCMIYNSSKSWIGFR